MIDTSSGFGAKLQRLATTMAGRRARMDLLESYYQGTNGIPVHANRAVSDSYRRLMAVSGLNLARLTVEATRERMKVLGIRTADDDGFGGNNRAWEIWQANSLDADHMLLDRSTLVMGRSFAVVGNKAPDTGAPRIAIKDPRNAIVEYAPDQRRMASSGLYVWVDEDNGVDRFVFFPEPGRAIEGYRPRPSSAPAGVENLDMAGWEWFGDWYQLPVPYVPMVEFANAPMIGGEVVGEFEPYLSTLDRINFNILNRLELLTLQAFKQRGIKGLPLKDPITGEEIDYTGLFLSGPGELWQLPETAEIWESGNVDLSSIIAAERQDIVTYAGATATPVSYLFPDDAGGSAEGAALKREAAVFKSLDRQAQQGESYEQLMWLALLADGQDVARGGIEIIWAPPERYTLAQKAEAAAKYAAAGVPLHVIATDVLQMSIRNAEKLVAESAADKLLGLSSGALA